MDSLHKEGETKTEEEVDALKGIELSPIIALHEQFLFYLAPVAGLQFFGPAVAGWLVFKGLSKYARWAEPKAGDTVSVETQRDTEHTECLRLQRKELFRQAGHNHNRFQIFLIDTAISVAAGGIAGWVYHFVLTLLELHPELIRILPHTL